MSTPKPKLPKLEATKDYDLFVFTKKNRAIMPSHVRNVGKHIDRKNLSAESPIIVKPLNPKYADEKHIHGKHIILEGQHRFMALKDRNEWIVYQVSENFEIEDIPHYNTSRRDWGFDQFMNHWCLNDINAYKIYAGFKKRSGWAHSNLLLMLMNNTSGALKAFKDGKFEVRMQISEANDLIDRVNDFGEYLEFYKTRAFIKACTVMFRAEGYNHKKMLSKLEYLSTRILKSVYWDDYVKQLETVFNYKSQGRTIRFY